MPGEPLPVQLSDAAFQAVVADVLIMPVFDDDEPTTLGLPAAPQAILATARKQREFKAKPATNSSGSPRPSDWKCPRILALGAGARRDYSSERARRLAMAGGIAARNRNLGRVAFVQRGIGSAASAAANGPSLSSTSSAAAAHNDPIYETQVIAEGLVLCSFDGDTYKTYKTSPRDAGPLVDVQIIAKTGAPAALKQAVAKGRILGECSNVAKGLANEPSNKLTPKLFAERAGKSCKDVGLPFEVLDEKQIADLKMGMLLGVAHGSLEPPRADRHALHAARRDQRNGLWAGARPGGEGRHVRHRRHFDQAGRRHGADEGRHGRRRRGDRRDARHRAAQAAHPGDWRGADGREHAERDGDQAGRRPDQRERQDRRGDQHRRRRPPDSRRRASGTPANRAPRTWSTWPR